MGQIRLSEALFGEKPILIWVVTVIFITIAAIFFLWRSFPSLPLPSPQETSSSATPTPSASTIQTHYERTDEAEEMLVEEHCSRALKENLQ